MKKGDLVKVKDACAFGGVYMQGIAGREALILSYREQSPLSCFILVGGKKYLVWARDLEGLDEAR
jgi:hypothetical protein